MRSVAYGLNVVVTFISITYVGGLPFVIAGWSVIEAISYQKVLTSSLVLYWLFTIKLGRFMAKLQEICGAWIQ